MRATEKRRPALATPARENENPDAQESTRRAETRKPAEALVLAETRRPSGGRLRVTREEIARRDVVKLAHLSESGATVHAFIIEPGELPAVVSALMKAAP